MGSAASRPTLFLRNATGLVKAWSTFDAFVYSFWSVNLVTLGLYGMSFVYNFPDGQLLASILIFGVLVTFMVVAYAALVTVMPRTGGDYAWQSRVLGGGVGFVLAITGWWFTLWLWTPIYANILVVQFFSPLAYTLGATGVATFFTSQWGVFVSCLITLAFVSLVVTLGMEAYARIQKICFWIGLVGLAVTCALLLFASTQDFQNAFNREATSLFGAPANAYQATIDAAGKGGFTGHDFSFFALGPTLLILPFLAFYLLWPNWGATLYGEVRGAKEYRKPFFSMFWGLWVTIALVALVMVLTAKTMGWQFYNASNSLYWNSFSAGAPTPVIPIWPYPIMFAGFLVNNHLFQAALIIVMGLWFFGWAGTLFLSSTRVIFAAAFDRVLPAWAANISAKRRVPYGSLALMVVPSLIVSALFAWNVFGFAAAYLDATAVIAITFMGTLLAAIILPWRRKDIYNASPIANYKVAGLPVISVAGAIAFIFIAFMVYEWATNATYGSNSRPSAIYLGATYLLAVVIYGVAYYVRRRQGIDLSRIHHEIPVE
jgi:amino acid transporter